MQRFVCKKNDTPRNRQNNQKKLRSFLRNILKLTSALTTAYPLWSVAFGPSRAMHRIFVRSKNVNNDNEANNLAIKMIHRSEMRCCWYVDTDTVPPVRTVRKLWRIQYLDDRTDSRRDNGKLRKFQGSFNIQNVQHQGTLLDRPYLP